MAEKKAGVMDLKPLMEVIRTLRAPGGCPWDRVQTHRSMRRELVEEDLGEYVDTAFPPENVYKGQESYSYLGEALDKLYTKLWLQVKVE